MVAKDFLGIKTRKQAKRQGVYFYMLVYRRIFDITINLGLNCKSRELYLFDSGRIAEQIERKTIK